jgi:DNA-binding SARP family transcriptional activator/Flp pilus assembly protein TadD
VRLLGPVDVTVDGVPRPVQGLRRKAVLAVLALHRGGIVSVDRLVDIVWSDETAARVAVNTLQSHVSYLRRLLGSKAAIVARPPGYLLDLGDEGTDVQVAERLIGQGRPHEDPAQRVTRLHAALGLWRGRPLADVTALSWLAEQAERLDQLWLQATQALIEARLALGEHVLVVPDLERLAAEHPFDEQVHAQLMLALYRSGRQADALAVYHQLRRALADDLGIDPGQQVRELYTAIMRQDVTLDAPISVPAVTLPEPPLPVPVSPAAPVTVVPAQLPTAIQSFAGRSRQLERLDATLPGTGVSRPGAAVVTVVSGTAGVGKTTLAVHWAHRIADRFPDGQLYVNLRGFDPGGSILEPDEAVRGFLDAFGVDIERIPAGLPAQTALYRSLLAGKRVLVVLDNARDVEQVRPLLPGGAGCLAIVTSRSQLTGLVATEGAHLLTVDLLTAAESRELLTQRLGAARVAGEPEAVDAIVTRCAGLPLALAIAAARAVTHADFPLGSLAAELRDAAATLDALDGGDPATDVRAVLSWSHRTLSEGAARLFRLLGVHPGPDISASAAASLAGIPATLARQQLTELTRAHLLSEHVPGRYTFHDLLRAYATEQSRGHETDELRRAALHRVLDHYLHTASAADKLITNRDPIELSPARPGVTLEELNDFREAMDWFATDSPVIVAAIDLAVETGFDTHAWQLAWTLTTYLVRHAEWSHLVAMQQTALAAADRLGNVSMQALTHRILANSFRSLDQYDQAQKHFSLALDLFGELGDPLGEALTHAGLGVLLEQLGRYREALVPAKKALELYEAAGSLHGRAHALNNVGWTYSLIGDHRQALEYCQRALALHQQLGDPYGQAAAWDSLGHAHQHLGHYREAVACYQHAQDLYTEISDRYNLADVLVHLGDAHDGAGNTDDARKAWQQALDIFDQLHHARAEQVRAKLG